VECAEWESSSAVGCGTVQWNVLIGRVAVQWAAVHLWGCAVWECSSAVGRGTLEWIVLSGRVIFQWAAVQ